MHFKGYLDAKQTHYPEVHGLPCTRILITTHKECFNSISPCEQTVNVGNLFFFTMSLSA